MSDSLLPGIGNTTAKSPNHDKAVRKAAHDLEAAFLAEMLKSAGLGKSRDSYGGGTGEDQFSSFLIREQANQMSRAGGIGLAENLYKSLMESQKND